MRVTWDERKNRSNAIKHGISFETAALVFDDPQAQSRLERIVEGEERWQTIGSVGGILILLIAHAWHEEDGEESIHIISAQKARHAKGHSTKNLSRKQKKELRALAAQPDSEIDLTDIPEIIDWSGAVVGKFYRPIKKSLTIRVDADVLAWLRSQGKGYQTRINQLLRAAMNTPSRKRRA